MAEYNGASNGMAWTKSYIYLGGRLLATDSTSGVQYHHPDRLGTRLVTNTSGAVVSENINLPFGATISGESLNLASSATKKRFTSYDRSETTKLDYAVNRHYSSAQGRFTQVDPIGMSATQLEDPQSLNLYAYVGNDPINYTDPSGLFSFKNLFAKAYKVFARIAVVMLVVAIVIGLSMTGPAGPGAFMIFKMALGAVKFAIDGWGNGNKFLQYVSAGIGAYLGFEVSGSFAKTNSTFGKASGAIIGAVSGFLQVEIQERRISSEVYRSAQQAAIFALKKINPTSIKERAEYAGRICKFAGGYVYTEALRHPSGNPNFSAPRSASSIGQCPTGYTNAGDYHTHGGWDQSSVINNVDWNERFSPSDIRGITGEGKAGFLATPTGRIYRYDPATGHTADLTSISKRTTRK